MAPLFPHERYQSDIKDFEDRIKELKEKLSKPIDSFAIMQWELETLIDTFSFGSCSKYTISTDFYINKKITPEEFDNFFTSIEEILNSYGYEIDLDYINKNNNKQIYHFIKDENTATYIEIRSAVCQKVKTGKMIPETKNDCNFIKN